MAEEVPFTGDEIRKLRELLEIEAIRKVSTAYSHCLDSGEIEALAALFTEDAECVFGPFGEWGGSRQTIRENYQKVFDSEARMEFGILHNNCNHWAELTSPTTAVGRSYLIDVYTHREPTANPIQWLGVYDIAYQKLAGEWLIKRLGLQFLWPQRELTADFSGPFPANRAAGSDQRP